ncbi:MAG TPA: arginine--tRNA ligase [Solirubrobacterales bacterium]|jgi:arginyl-tRNA synthetase|nr:arginine--tRNA ligase [Solirubrobacterales bacterium]
MADPLETLRVTIRSAADSLRDGSPEAIVPTLERPPKRELGDYSTNAAMLLAPARGEPPREIAERLREDLGARLAGTVDRIEVAGPGFVNVFLADRWYREAVVALLAAGPGFGGGSVEEREPMLVEFVSANPTGPLHAASGRHAAYGDALARVLAFAGHDVEREYYLNDTGRQVRQFAESIAARMQRQEPPEDGYRGDYVIELAETLAAAGADPGDVEGLARRGTEIMRERIESTLGRFGVRFDTWSSERSMYERGAVESTLERLRESGHVYEREGAVWLRTTSFGDEKDRVLIRSDGEPTYFAPDIAYHYDKLGRGDDHLIDVLGADHHGYVPRMRAAIAALGEDADRFEVQMIQMVHLAVRGERAQMSKRQGTFVALDDLIDDIGTDATRFFLLQRSHETMVDVDLDLARKESPDNPVYYVQYAHARIASILRKARAEDAAPPDEGPDGVDERAVAAAAEGEGALATSAEPAERALIQRLLELPMEVQTAAERRTPHRLTAYATATAADFHAFYRDCQVVGAGEGLQEARLALAIAAERVIARTLDLLGVSAPERM